MMMQAAAFMCGSEGQLHQLYQLLKELKLEQTCLDLSPLQCNLGIITQYCFFFCFF